MNAGLTFAAILSLILGITGSGNTDLARKVQSADSKDELVIKKDGANRGFLGVGTGAVNSPTGVNLNHNETLVRDTMSIQPASEQNAWTDREHSFSTSLLLSFLTYRISGGQCSPLICGSNHNETILRDTPVNQQANAWSLQVGAEESFSTSLLLSFLTYHIGGGCSPMVCGSNHNETMMGQITSAQGMNNFSPRVSTFQHRSRLKE